MRPPTEARHPWARLALTACIAGLLASPSAQAKMDITFDAETLTNVLRALVPPIVSVPVLREGAVTLRLEDFEVVGFDPGAGEGGRGHLLAAVRVKVPELSLDARVEPRLSLELTEKDGLPVCLLRFESAEIPLPLAGALDIAPLISPVVLPAENLSVVEAAGGLFDVRSRLLDVRMGSSLLRFVFDLDVSPSEGKHE